jgi:dTDP-4-dehydrorhamnose reductase
LGEHGQVAQAVERECVRQGHSVRLAGRATADVGDRTGVDAFVRAFKPDVVVNTAAFTAVDAAEDDPASAFRVNRDGAANVAAAARDARALLIHLSTDYVFDGTKASPYVETDAPHPLNVYGASKLAGETAVLALDGTALVLRTSWVFSAEGRNFVKTILRLASERQELRVVDDQRGTPTFAADLAQAIVTIAERVSSATEREKLGGVYHVAGSGDATWYRFACAIVEAAADRNGPPTELRAIPTSDYPTRAKRPLDSRLDCSKAAREFGVRLPPWQDSLRICLDNLLNADQVAP